MSNVVSTRVEAGIGLIAVDNPPVNALSQPVRQGLLDATRVLVADPAVDAIVLYCVGRTFMAGADIKEFGKPIRAPALADVIDAIEISSKPVIAALHGTALGGGFEVALGCHYRCALPTARVGLPEVKLGLLPGAGGTQRSPRLMGVEAALALMIGGTPIAATDALEKKLIDEIVAGEFPRAAIDYARRLLAAGAQPRRVSEMRKPQAPAAFFEQYRASIATKTRGLFAPTRIVEAVQNATFVTFAEGLARERELFNACMDSTQSAGLRHVFFAEREAARIPGVDRKIPARTIARAAVIGAGTMGGGIAMNFANAGLPVRILEVDQNALDRGLGTIRKNYDNTRAKGRLSEAQVEQRMALIDTTLDYEALADADLVIEAAFENLALKKDIFARLDSACKPGAILASNTSTLDLNQIARATARPQDVIGLHFFSPANVMKLLEIVRGDRTAPEIIATCMKLTKTIGKVGVLSGVCYGFIGNRMLEGYAREAGLMLLEGAAPEAIDKVMYDFGFPMGPHAVNDLAGVDVGAKIREERRTSGTLPDDPRYGVIADRLAAIGRYGQKTGAGIYRYEQGARTPLPDPEVTALIEAEATRLGIERHGVDAQQILERCLYPMISEGARILEEGIALRPGDIDIVWIYGYGFPAYRGGPMFYADTIGLDRILARIHHYARELGNEHGYWTPAGLLLELARTGSSFAEWSASRSSA